jgi:hypothetical protein
MQQTLRKLLDDFVIVFIDDILFTVGPKKNTTVIFDKCYRY